MASAIQKEKCGETACRVGQEENGEGIATTIKKKELPITIGMNGRILNEINHLGLHSGHRC